MRAVIAFNEKAEHQKLWGGALYEGLRRFRVQAQMLRHAEASQQHPDFVATWGWRRAVPYTLMGIDVLVMERGYVGDRTAWTSLGWNGLNGRADFCAKDAPGDRWERHFHGVMRQWKDPTDGHYLVLMGQVPSDQAVMNVDLAGWYLDMVDKADQFGMPIKFRPHPQSPESYPLGIEIMKGTLEDALREAFGVVTFNSNSGVDAALAGVPVIAYDKGSMAWPVASHSLPFMNCPEREKWAHQLAYCQWREDEIRAGLPWDRLRHAIKR